MPVRWAVPCTESQHCVGVGGQFGTEHSLLQWAHTHWVFCYSPWMLIVNALFPSNGPLHELKIHQCNTVKAVSSLCISQSWVWYRDNPYITAGGRVTIPKWHVHSLTSSGHSALHRDAHDGWKLHEKDEYCTKTHHHMEVGGTCTGTAPRAELCLRCSPLTPVGEWTWIYKKSA